MAINNAHNHGQALENRAPEEELSVAREIQQGLLLRHVPEVDGFDIAAMNIPNQQVGGDYYGVIRIDKRRIGVAIGDVSGKGTPAALLMATLQATLRTLAREGLRPKDLMARMNSFVYENTSPTQSTPFSTEYWTDAAGLSRTATSGTIIPSSVVWKTPEGGWRRVGSFWE